MRKMILSLTFRSKSIFQHLTTLRDKLERHKNLFSFLSKVSNQAALLSLNSGIVASNIRGNKQALLKLQTIINRFADKTATSTGDIQKIIKEIFLSIDHIHSDVTHFLHELNECSEKLNTVEKHLSCMTIRIDNQTEKFLSINKIMQDQAHIAGEIKEYLNNLVALAKEIAIICTY